MPRVLHGSSPGRAGTWIGAQAPGHDGPFIQIGTNEERHPTSDYYYAFWSDTTNHFSAQYLFTVKPGDKLSASLVLAHGLWTLAIVDSSSGVSAHFATSEEAGGSFNLAEWLQEDITNMATNKPFPYPRLATVGFRKLTVNSRIPTYADLHSQWLAANGSNLAPSPLRDDSFTLRSATVSPGGRQYLRIATSEDLATEAFGAQLQRWTDKTPRAQIADACAKFATALRSNNEALLSARWSEPVRAMIRSLASDTRVLQGHMESLPPSSSPGLVSWTATWTRDADALGNTARAIRRALGLPEISFVR